MSGLQVGDFVVYPGQGVGRVQSIEQRDLAGQSVRCVLLHIEATDHRIWIPTERIARCQVRGVIPAASAPTVLGVFDHQPRRQRGVSWIRRSRRYEEQLGSSDLEEVAEVYRDLYRMKLSGPLSFGQIRLLEKSSRMVIHELAISLKQSPEEIEGMIRRRISATVSAGSNPVSTAL